MLFIAVPKLYQTGLLILAQIAWSSAGQGGCEERGPVCGNDGKTYLTMCQLIWARLEDSDLQVLHDGSCYGEYLSGSSDPTQAESDVNSGSSTQAIFGNLQNHGKIQSLMPYGWPPLGPTVTQHMYKSG